MHGSHLILKRLKLEEMLELSAPWVGRVESARAAIARTPVLAVLLPMLEQAHAGVVAVRPPADEVGPRELLEREAEVDARHAELVCAIHGVLSACALGAPPALEPLAVRDLLLPEGLRHAKKTYRAQSGHAGRTAARIDERMRERLAAIAVWPSSLLVLVERWIDVARQLGELEDARARLDPPSTVSADQYARARVAWIDAALHLRAAAGLAGLDPQTDRLILGPLRSAEATAERRRGRAGLTSRPPSIAKGSGG